MTNDQSGMDPGTKSRGRKRRRKGLCLQDRPLQNLDAAGIDIGVREIFVAVPAGRDEDPVRMFETFTEDLPRMADWLLACPITTVAMESTRRAGETRWLGEMSRFPTAGCFQGDHLPACSNQTGARCLSPLAGGSPIRLAASAPDQFVQHAGWAESRQWP